MSHQSTDFPIQPAISQNQPYYDDFFEDDDYWKYVNWDGKTKFRLDNIKTGMVIDSPDLYKVFFDDDIAYEGSRTSTHSQFNQPQDVGPSQAHLRSGRIRPPRLPPIASAPDPGLQILNAQTEEVVEERHHVQLETGIEYDLLGHLTKIPAKVSILDLIKTSPMHKK